MGDINQYAISKALGSTMRPIKRGRFGNFGLLETLAEGLRAREATPEFGSELSRITKFSYPEDAIVVRAFEDVRDGASTDALLWDRELAESFYQRCRELGLNAPDSLLGRRLITVRKNISRYRKRGITISPTTKNETHESVVPQYAHIIEFVLVKMRYRYGVSIDDILLDRKLGDMFDEQASSLASGASAKDLRLGALDIRKSRNYRKQDRDKLDSLDLGVIERALSEPLSLAKVKPRSVPEEPGILEIRESDRYLYITRNKCLRPVVEQFHSGKAFQLVANGFWTPNLETITIQFVSGEKVGGFNTNLWERRLIHDREPVFNWPILGDESEEAA